ncbi:MAG: chromosomal replication initiator protein DnaA [Desulfurivibrionaceae bacterium]
MLWQQIKEILTQKIPENTYSLWISPLEGQENDEGHLKITGPDQFFVSWINDNYLGHINEALAELGQKNKEILFEVKENDSKEEQKLYPIQARQQSLPSLTRGKSCVRTLHPRYTFKEFVLGETNAFARSACESIAVNDTSAGNYVYLKAGTGLGKSHLSHAVAHHIMDHSPSTRLHFLSSQQLTAEMIRNIRNHTMDKFKRKYHKECDVLLIEDIQTLSGRSKTQDELAEIIDILIESGKRVIFTSSQAPTEIANIDSGFQSRLTGGLITTINPPDQRTRSKIIRRKAYINNLELSEEVIDYMADTIKGDVRQIESAVISLKAQTNLLKTRPDLDIVKEILKNVVYKEAPQLSPEAILELVSEQFKISADELKSKSRKKTVSFPRQIIMYLSRKYTDYSLADIGRILNRDHSTVVHSIRSISQKQASNASVSGQLDYLSKKLEQKIG